MPPSKTKTRPSPRFDARLKTSVAPARAPYVARVDARLRYVEASDEYLKRAGLTREQLLGRSFAEMLDPLLWAALKEYADRALLGLPQSFSVGVTLNGRQTLVEGHYLPQPGGGFMILSFDRSEQAHAKLAYEALFDQAGEGIAETDLQGRLVRVNDRYSEIVGRDKESLIGTRVKDITHPDDQAMDEAAIRALAQKGGRSFTEKRLMRPDGTPIWVTAAVSILRGADGQPMGAMKVVHDLTPRRKALEALQLSEERHRAVGEASPVGLFQTTLEGRLTYVNSRCAELMGAAVEELMGPGWLDLVHPEDLPGVREKIRASRAEGRENLMEYRVVRPDGTIRWLSGKSAPMRDVEGRIVGYAGVLDDITERRLVELERAALLRQVQDERRKLSDIMDAVPALVWEARGLKVEDLRMAFMSPYAAELLGAPIVEYAYSGSGKGLGTGLVHPEDRHLALEAVRRSMETGKPDLFEFRAVTADKRVLWLEARVRPILDRDGRAIGTRGVALDITARKQAEETMRRAETAQREFIANVSHDFRTPLASIKGYAETLLGGADKQPATRRRFTKTILKNALRLEELVEDILTVSAVESGAQRTEPVTLDLAAFVAGMQDEFAPVLRPKGLTLKCAVPARLKVRFDRKHLGQILDNLVSNAARYNKRGGWISVTARRPARTSKFVEVCVADNGIGISAEHLPRVFDRFYRVDQQRSAASKASGLGLHIVKRLVEAGGGSVRAESTLDRGSKFLFTVPAVK